MSDPLPTGPALAVDGQVVDYEDLIVAGIDDGRWDRLVRQARLAVEAASPARATDDDLVRDAAVAFRRERGLEAGADLGRWLRDRGLDLAGLRRHLAGRVRPAAPARRRMSGPAADAEPHPAASDQELLVALRFEAFASGFWREAGLDVARGIAALVTTDRSRAAPGCAGFGRGATARLDVREEDEDGGDRRAGTGRRDHRRPGAPARSVPGRPADHDRRRAAVRAGAAARRERAARLARSRGADLVAGDALAWTRVWVEGCRLPSGSAAREAVLCATVDGLDRAEVRRRAGGVAVSWDALTGDLPAPLAGRLLGAAPGEVVGPIAGPDGFDVLWVVDRRRPDPADPVLRSVAADRATDEHLDAWLAGRVRWLGPC